MSYEAKKREPQDEKTSLSFISWNLKELVTELKAVHEDINRYMRDQQDRGLKKVPDDNVPF
jgi:hypothetical protein